MALGDKKFGRGSRDLSGIQIAGHGPVSTGYLLLGERPGKQEIGARPPRFFAGVGANEMERYLAHGECPPLDQWYVTSMVKDYRGSEDTEEWEVIRDEPVLKSELEACCPYIIATMGGLPTRYFLGDVDMDVVRGIPHHIVHPEYGPLVIVPLFTPYAGFYNGDNQPEIMDDFRRLGMVVRGEYVHPEPAPSEFVHEPSYCGHFHEDGEHATLYGPTHRLALDTEGWLHNPWGLSHSPLGNFGFVAKKGENMVSMLDLRIAQACEADPEFRVYLHNSPHDLPILDGLGVHIPEDRFIDTMVLAYLLCIEPQGLKPLAFRKCGMRMQSYEETVAPYYRAVFEEYVRTAAEIPNLPEYEQEYVIIVPDPQGGEGQVKVKKPWGMARHLRRILSDAAKAESSGQVFDFAKRWDNIDDYKKTVVLQTLGEPPEPNLEYVPDAEAIPYSGCDAVATRRIGPILEQQIVEMGLETISRIDHSILPMVDRMQRTGFKADPDYFDRLAEECTAKMANIQQAIKQATGAFINPDSGDQVAALLFDQLKLERKVDFDIKKTEDGERYSTNDKILEALRFTHPVVGLVCDYREVSKVRSSFCWPISRYARQDPDRRIHPNLRVTRVSSGRLSCTKPNLLAIPVRSDLGVRVREGFITDEGHVLGGWDLDQVEMREMAHQSQDKVLLECFRLGLDVHTKTASMAFGVPYEEILADKKLKKRMRDPAKRIGFGVITGITEIGLAAQLRLANATKNGLPMGEGGDPWTEDDCANLIKTYFDIHTGVRDYFDECRAEARRNGFVRDRCGRIRYLPGVHSPIKWIAEEALRQSHSFKISASAQGVMKQGMAAIWECIKQWWRDGRWIEPLLQVHDEIELELADDPEFKQEVDWMVVNCLTQTTTISVPLGAKGGFALNWGGLK